MFALTPRFRSLLPRAARPLLSPVRTLCTSPAKPPVAPAVGYWLFGCAGMVFGMVVLGGATRLTKSGLSMVEWKPHTFTKPSTQAEWEAEFENYKKYPEWKRVNKHMTLEDFKVRAI